MNKVQKLGTVTLTVVVFLLVASYFLAMLLGPALFFLTPAGFDFSLREVRPSILLFLILWSIFMLCFLAAWRLRESFHDVVSKAFSRPFSKIFNNWLFAMPIIASMLYAAVFLIIDLQNLFGVPTGEISEQNPFVLYLSLSYASVIEEIGFRITPMGTFLLAQLFLIQSWRSGATSSFSQRFELFLASFLYPDRAKRMVGVKNVAVNGIRDGISRGEWIMLLFTSLIFGAVHLVAGIGWEAGKITSASLQGFVFGVVYLAYGVQAPILLHWFFDYYFYTYELDTLYYANTSGILIGIDIINLILGHLGLLVFTILGLKKILTRWKKVTW